MSRIAVIDTETNWNNEIMSIGVVAATPGSYTPEYVLYLVLSPEKNVGGMYDYAMRLKNVKTYECSRAEAIEMLTGWLSGLGITSLFAYNAAFDCKHLPELCDFDWYDIMKIAAYRQYNPCISEDAECCKTGRLKHSYGVESILRMLTGNCGYCETHNALLDALDELKIMRLLGYPTEVYENTRVN